MLGIELKVMSQSTVSGFKYACIYTVVSMLRQKVKKKKNEANSIDHLVFFLPPLFNVSVTLQNG